MGLFHWIKNACAGDSLPDVRIPDASGAPPVRRRFRFSGCVQGVGFRYEATILAGQLRLTGWVRNESDGTVVVEAEGEPDRIDAFLRAMRAVPRFDITGLQEEELPPSGRETAFRVRY